MELIPTVLGHIAGRERLLERLQQQRHQVDLSSDSLTAVIKR